MCAYWRVDCQSIVKGVSSVSDLLNDPEVVEAVKMLLFVCVFCLCVRVLNWAVEW